METDQITKQILAFQKGVFTSWHDAMSTLQDQTASTMDTLLNQANWLPAEGRQVTLKWISACKEESDRFRAYVEAGFSDLEKYLAKSVAVESRQSAAVDDKSADVQAPVKSAQ